MEEKKRKEKKRKEKKKEEKDIDRSPDTSQRDGGCQGW